MTPRIIGRHATDRIYGGPLLGCAVALVLALAAPAAAQQTIPPNNGGATQYIPPAEDPGGDKPANPAEPGNPSALPPAARAQLPPGAEGDLLAKIATSPGYGAPSGSNAGSSVDGAGGDGQAGNGAKASKAAKHEDAGNAASAAASAVTEPGVAILLAAVLALTLGTVAFARSRKRRGD